MARKKKPKSKRYGTELIEWSYLERYQRKGWLQRDFYINSRHYRFTSFTFSDRGLIRRGLLVGDHDAHP